MSDDDQSQEPDAEPEPRAFADGERVLLWATIVSTRDAGHHLLDIAGERCNPSRADLEACEATAEQMPRIKRHLKVD